MTNQPEAAERLADLSALIRAYLTNHTDVTRPSFHATALTMKVRAEWLDAASDRAAAIYAPDGVDGHPCIRVEAYMEAMDKVAAAQAVVERVEALADEWEAERYPDTGDAGWNNGYDMRRETDIAALRAALSVSATETPTAEAGPDCWPGFDR